MRAIGTENRVFAAVWGVMWVGFGYAAGFTKFEIGVGLIGTYLMYLLVCVTDYLHLIGERLEEMDGRASEQLRDIASDISRVAWQRAKHTTWSDEGSQ